MPATIPNLWPQSIKVDALSPLTILRSQAAEITKLTKGILEGEIKSSTEDGQVNHQFDLVAPAVGGYRHRLMTVSHAREMVYPATIRADCFEPEGSRYTFEEHVVSSSESDFLATLGSVLNSPEVQSVVHSLLARSNEAALDH